MTPTYTYKWSDAEFLQRLADKFCLRTLGGRVRSCQDCNRDNDMAYGSFCRQCLKSRHAQVEHNRYLRIRARKALPYRQMEFAL